MNKKKYLEDRKLLLDEAQKLIDEGKIEVKDIREHEPSTVYLVVDGEPKAYNLGTKSSFKRISGVGHTSAALRRFGDQTGYFTVVESVEGENSRVLMGRIFLVNNAYKYRYNLSSVPLKITSVKNV